MSNVNSVTLIGNVVDSVDLRFLTNGRAVGTLRLATNETWKDSDGNKHESVQFHRVQVWGKDAENAAKFLGKGRLVMVNNAKIQYRSYEKDGVKHYVTEIVARPGSITFLGKKSATSEPVAPQDAPVDDVYSTDIPL